MSEPFVFRRPELASEIADALAGKSLFSARSGLFLAAPRRTGKSTFLRHDLLPELATRKVITAYTDLWADKSKDPSELIVNAVRQVIAENENALVRAAKKSGLSKVGFGSFASFDVARIGAAEGPTLADALKALVEVTRKPVALIVDEAQHALSTEAGVNTMFALKAARDALNLGPDAPDVTPLQLVFTGSHRDKLANLVLRRDQPFFGGSVTDFPLLGRNYAEAYATGLNRRLAADNRFDAADVWAAFQILGHRPELLETALRDAALGPRGAQTPGEALRRTADGLRERLWDDYESDYGALTALQRAVLARLVDMGAKFAPFSKASLAAYGAETGGTVAPIEVQNALEDLRRKGIVWKANRGSYALEDQDLIEWFKARESRQ